MPAAPGNTTTDRPPGTAGPARRDGRHAATIATLRGLRGELAELAAWLER